MVPIVMALGVRGYDSCFYETINMSLFLESLPTKTNVFRKS